MIAGCMCYGIYTASHIMAPFARYLQNTSQLGVQLFTQAFSRLTHTQESEIGHQRFHLQNLLSLLIWTDSS